MKRYLVGGAVRDRLLGLTVREKDWVVTGATPEQMVAAGYRPVGKDFPVFLHPQTKEEHALARTERKSGRGYHGFTFHTGIEVSVEEDLIRRDLTINAIAEDDDGRIVDPHGGRRDLDARVLRHVSPSFSEDPVRILRVARFAARFAALGFRVADETLALMRQMVDAGEVDHLVPERVWKETERALSGDGRNEAGYRPATFFETLHACSALARLMPELAALDGVPQRAEYHPEIDTLVHTLMSVDAATRMGFSLPVHVAALLHDLGKGATPSLEWPSHHMHDTRGVPLVEGFAARLRLPKVQAELAVAVAREHLLVHRAEELRPPTLLQLLERLRAFQRGPGNNGFFDAALDACLCDARGRRGLEHSDYPPPAFLREAAGVARSVQARDVMTPEITGAAVGEALAKARVERLREWKAARKAA